MKLAGRTGQQLLNARQGVVTAEVVKQFVGRKDIPKFLKWRFYSLTQMYVWWASLMKEYKDWRRVIPIESSRGQSPSELYSHADCCGEKVVELNIYLDFQRSLQDAVTTISTCLKLILLRINKVVESIAQESKTWNALIESMDMSINSKKAWALYKLPGDPEVALNTQKLLPTKLPTNCKKMERVEREGKRPSYTIRNTGKTLASQDILLWKS